MRWQFAVAMVGVAVLALALAPDALAQKDKDKGEANTRSVHGLVTDRAGAPLEKAVVHLKNIRNLQVRTQITDAAGAFRFHGLNLNTDYELHAEHQGESSPTKTISSFDTRKEVHITLKIDQKK